MPSVRLAPLPPRKVRHRVSAVLANPESRGGICTPFCVGGMEAQRGVRTSPRTPRVQGFLAFKVAFPDLVQLPATALDPVSLPRSGRLSSLASVPPSVLRSPHLLGYSFSPLPPALQLRVPPAIHTHPTAVSASLVAVNSNAYLFTYCLWCFVL